MSGSLHGSYVISDGNGGYLTRLTQTGTVSAVSATSITVRSEDGFSQTYVVSDSTTVTSESNALSDIESGETVQVIGTEADQTATATTITDTEDAAAGTQQGGTQQGGTQGGVQQGGPGGGMPGGGQGTMPSGAPDAGQGVPGGQTGTDPGAGAATGT